MWRQEDELTYEVLVVMVEEGDGGGAMRSNYFF